MGEARKAFRRERSEEESRTAEEVRKLALLRDEIEHRETETAADRYRLRQLRRRILLRCKRRQGAESRRLHKVAETLDVERGQVKADRIALQADRERIREAYTFAYTELQTEREELARREDALRGSVQRQQEDQERRAKELAGEAARLTGWQQRFQIERQGMEQRCSRLRIEAEGLEKRASLEQNGAIVSSNPLLPSLDQLADELSDQRQILAEQIQRFVKVHEEWLRLEQSLAEELEGLTLHLADREQRVFESGQYLEQDRELLTRERMELQQQHAKLEQGYVELTVREEASRELQSRREADLMSRDSQIRRQEELLGAQMELQRQRRRQELSELQLEHSRCQALRQRWLASLARGEEQFTAIHSRERELADQAALLERSRQELVRSVPDRATAVKRIERYERRAQRASRKIDAVLATQRTELAGERESVEELLRSVEDRIEELAALRRENLAANEPEEVKGDRRLSA